MKSAKRRSFLFLAASTLTGLPCVNGLSQQDEIPKFDLSSSDVESGLKRGLRFRKQDNEVLSFLQLFSKNQVMIGGGVLTFAAGQPTEWIHLLVRIDDLQKFMNVMSNPRIPWGGARASHGNTLAFEYKGQNYYIETLVDKEYAKRLAGLKEPGKEVNGFRVEFAHDAVIYGLQSKRYSDPFDAVGRSNKIELKRVAPEAGIPSAVRILVEEKTMGMEVPREEREFAKQTIDGVYTGKRDAQDDSIKLLSGISRLAENTPPDELREIMLSNLAGQTIEETLEERIRKFAALRDTLERLAPGEASEGALWHLSMRCLEDTDNPECEVEAELALIGLGGYDDLYTKRDLATSGSAIMKSERVRRERTKQPELDKLDEAANAAPPGIALAPNHMNGEGGYSSKVGSDKRTYMKYSPNQSRTSSELLPHLPERLEELRKKTPVQVPLLKRTIPEN